MTWLDRTEPRLEDALSDPVVRAVMRRDGVAADEIRMLVARVNELRQRIPLDREAA